jgi:hypothetical protein
MTMLRRANRWCYGETVMSPIEPGAASALFIATFSVILVACGPPAGDQPALTPASIVTVPPPAPAPDPTVPPAPPPADPKPVEPPPATNLCARKDQFGPVRLDEAAWESRPFKGAKHFEDVASSKDNPVLACGAAHSYALINELTCKVDDQSPLQQQKQKGGAQRARVGNVGPGGKCGNIIDLYRVKCPDGSEHDIFIDMYWCPGGQEFF